VEERQVPKERAKIKRFSFFFLKGSSLVRDKRIRWVGGWHLRATWQGTLWGLTVEAGVSDLMRAASLLCGIPIRRDTPSASCRRRWNTLATQTVQRRWHARDGPPSRCAHTASAGDASFAPLPRSVLFVSFLWPETTSSAAGVRTTSLLRAFQSWGWSVHYLGCAKPNEHTAALEAQGITVHHVSPNRGAEFEATLQATAPHAVVFDRFMAEEAFSFRVRAAAPSAARILDMQDLHSLRYVRQAAVKDGLAAAEAAAAAAKMAARQSLDADVSPSSPAAPAAPTPSLVEAALAAVPAAGDDHLSRELASVHRCDLTLVCWPVEARLLRDRFQIPENKLVPASFFCDIPGPAAAAAAAEAAGAEVAAAEEGAARASPHLGFDERRGFVTIGTFYHPPNVDSVRWLAGEVWPLIRAELPTAEMRVWGSYPTEAVRQLHRPKQGFYVEGFAPTVEGAMAGPCSASPRAPRVCACACRRT